MPLFNDLRSKRQGYVPVTVIPSDSDSDEDDVFMKATTNGNYSTISEPESTEHIPMLVRSTSLTEIPLEPKTNREVHINDMKPCTTLIKQSYKYFCLSMTSLIAIAIVFGFLIQPYSDATLFGSPVANPLLASVVVWETKTRPYVSESVVRLEDLNHDGILDVLYTYVRFMNGISHGGHFCQSINMTEPCIGVLEAVDGRNGQVLWEKNVASDIFSLNCGKLDVNDDDWPDCLMAGRDGQLVAFSSGTGEMLWSSDKQFTVHDWNFYQPQVVSDLDGDGVGEVIVAHGGNITYGPDNTKRIPGRILLLSGKTGLSLGRPLNMSDMHETYSAITTYTRSNGAVYILFGSGGETIQGSLWCISLRDLYMYVTQKTLVQVSVPELKSSNYDERWGTPLRVTDEGVQEILRCNESKGVIVPTILADMNNDGINDLIVSFFNATVTILDGNDLSMIWTTGQRFSGHETYSNPAPGYFNDDHHLDIMVCLLQGTWPHYSQNTAVILDGVNGSTLWSTTVPSSLKIMSSPLSVQQDVYKSAFIFWLAGREHSLNEDHEEEEKYPAVGNQSPDGSRIRRHAKFSSTQCDNDTLQSLEAELLMIDRDSVTSPAVIFRANARAYYYELTNENPIGTKVHASNRLRERTLDNDDTNTYSGRVHSASRSNDDERNVQRMKRERATVDGPQCTPNMIMLVSTGTINDIDHDGSLDFLLVYSRSSTIYDGGFLTRSTMSLKRLKLRTHNLDKCRVPLNENMTYIRDRNCGKCQGRSSIRLINEGWLSYMGLKGDGVYNVNRRD